MAEPALVAWLNTFAPDDSTTLADFADGVVLLSVAEDVVEGFDFTRAAPGLAGVRESLEHAFGVRCGARGDSGLHARVRARIGVAFFARPA